MSVDSETKDGRKSINKRERQKDNERINKKNKKTKGSKEGRQGGTAKGREEDAKHTYNIKRKETITNLINTCYTFCHI